MKYTIDQSPIRGGDSINLISPTLSYDGIIQSITIPIKCYWNAKKIMVQGGGPSSGCPTIIPSWTYFPINKTFQSHKADNSTDKILPESYESTFHLCRCLCPENANF